MTFAFRKIFILVIVAIFAVGAGLFLKAQFFKNDNGALAQTTCVPLTYATGTTSTVGVPFNGVENSGTLNFTIADPGEAACAYQGASGLNIKGIVWNTNLGWINFEETGNYSTAINLTDGTFSGKAYGDNIGYIQMDGVRVAVADEEDSGQWCSGMVNKGDLYGYAWTDTVGWMNFCGAHVDLEALETPPAAEPDQSTAFTAEISFPTDGQTIYANGEDKHQVFITIKENGQQIKWSWAQISKRITVTPTWEDTVKADQITPCEYSDNFCPAVTKPFYFAWQTFASKFKADIISIAPTNADNKIKLSSVNIKIKDEDGASVIQEINMTDSNLPHDFTFSEPVSITQFKTTDSFGITALDEISAMPNSTTTVEMTAINKLPASKNKESDINIYTQLYDCSDEYDFVFGTSAPADMTVDRKDVICAESSGSNNKLTDVKKQTFDKITEALSIFTISIDPSTVEATSALGLQTVVDFISKASTPVKPVRYFSANLTKGSVLNQAADIKGNVNINIIDTTGLPASGKISQSIGEKAQSRRETFYRAVRGSIDFTNTSAVKKINPATVVILSGQDLNPPTGKDSVVKTFRRDKSAALKQPCTIIIDDTADIDFSGGTTIVSLGCDIYIDQNIRTATKKGRLGIIALEDLDMAGTRRGGNLYVCSRVTDLEANLVLDGSLFSYGKTTNECGNAFEKAGLVDQTTGYPNFTGKNAKQILKNQLTIVGSLVSNNTYGGSVSTPAILGDGSLATTDIEKTMARMTDINFLRYADTEKISGGVWGDSFCWASDVGLSKYFGATDPCDGSNNPDVTSIVNIIYKAPTNKMPVFNAVK